MRQHGFMQHLGAVARAGALVGLGLLGGAAWAEARFTTRFPLEGCTFVATGRSRLFGIQPGDWRAFEGREGRHTVRLEITVLAETRVIAFVTEGGTPLAVETRVVEEREWLDGELVEVSRNFYARCQETGDTYYFGEAVDIYEDGVVVSHDGAWEAGQDGALPGLMMPGTFLLGSRYVQEHAPRVARDRAEHVAMGLEVDVPAGTFRDCVKVVETSPLEPGARSVKRYCPDIGLVTDGQVKLVDLILAP